MSWFAGFGVAAVLGLGVGAIYEYFGLLPVTLFTLVCLGCIAEWDMRHRA